MPSYPAPLQTLFQEQALALKRLQEAELEKWAREQQHELRKRRRELEEDEDELKRVQTQLSNNNAADEPAIATTSNVRTPAGSAVDGSWMHALLEAAAAAEPMRTNLQKETSSTDATEVTPPPVKKRRGRPPKVRPPQPALPVVVSPPSPVSDNDTDTDARKPRQRQKGRHFTPADAVSVDRTVYIECPADVAESDAACSKKFSLIKWKDHRYALWTDMFHYVYPERECGWWKDLARPSDDAICPLLKVTDAPKGRRNYRAVSHGVVVEWIQAQRDETRDRSEKLDLLEQQLLPLLDPIHIIQLSGTMSTRSGRRYRLNSHAGTSNAKRPRVGGNDRWSTKTYEYTETTTDSNSKTEGGNYDRWSSKTYDYTDTTSDSSSKTEGGGHDDGRRRSRQADTPAPVAVQKLITRMLAKEEQVSGLKRDIRASRSSSEAQALQRQLDKAEQDIQTFNTALDGFEDEYSREQIDSWYSKARLLRR